MNQMEKRRLTRARIRQFNHALEVRRQRIIGAIEQIQKKQSECDCPACTARRAAEGTPVTNSSTTLQ
jgi:hypothetical protein